MKIITGARKSGKTTKLLYAAEVTGYPILASTLARKKSIEGYAATLGLRKIKVVTINEIKYSFDKNVLIDDGESIIEEVLKSYLGKNVVAVTLTAEEQL